MSQPSSPASTALHRYALTGGIGSGKSTIASLFVEQGAFLVDADAISRSLMEPGEAVLAGGGNRRHTRRDGSKVPWFYAYDGAGLAEQLEEAGLLEDAPQQPEVEA